MLAHVQSACGGNADLRQTEVQNDWYSSLETHSMETGRKVYSLRRENNCCNIQKAMAPPPWAFWENVTIYYIIKKA